MSSLVAGCHCSTTLSETKWFATSLRISLSSDTDSWNMCGCEVAMVKGKRCCKHEVRAGVKVELIENLEKKWRQRKE
jgi:hypothetical protein